MWGRIKLRRADTLFSLYLRKNAATDVNLTMHSFLKAEGLPFPIFGAEARTVRFDEENCDILSISHHAYFEEHKTEYETWKKDRMGEKAFNLLMLRAHTYHKKDAAPILMWLTLERLKNIIRGIIPTQSLSPRPLRA